MMRIGGIMEFISASGTGFAARTLASAALLTALVLPSAAAQADPPATPAHSLSIAIDGMRNTRGNMLVCVTANAAAFPDCSRDPASTRMRVPAASIHGQMQVSLNAAGTYAVAIVHDENGNGRLDTMMMMPREGFGFSRNPRMRMGPPRFTDAAFAVGEAPTHQQVRVRYML
jgi:uncharacterized protein (DUF2141 family)